MTQKLHNAKILAVETSSRLGSAALADGSRIIAAKSFKAGMRHGAELIPTVDSLCKLAALTVRDIEYLFVSVGPGSFTGLRVGITFARTLAQVINCRLVAVPTVDVIAENLTPKLPDQTQDVQIAVILDAKRQQVYAAAFQWSNRTLTKIITEQVICPADLLRQLTPPLWLVGEGIEYHQHALDRDDLITVDRQYWPPRAENVHACGLRLAQQDKFTALQDLTPTYLRLPEAEERWQQKNSSDKLP